MSAFMCSPETIHSVALYLSKISRIHRLECDEFQWEPLYWMLYDLNVKALKVRYPESYEEMIGDREEYAEYLYDVSPVCMDTNLVLLARLNCFKYQCTEGRLPEEDKIYKDVDFAIRVAMAEIIDNICKTVGFDPVQYWG